MTDFLSEAAMVAPLRPVRVGPAVQPRAAEPKGLKLEDWRDKYHRWLTQTALPLWASEGVDRIRGGFHEVLARRGRPPAMPRRARVQGRQSFVFAMAGRLEWTGPWQGVACQGLNWLQLHHLRDDGLYSTLTSADGRVLDSTAMTYDQSFALLAAAALHACGLGPGENYALGLLSSLAKARKCPGGGFAEVGDRFLSNPNMHLLEAALAWIEAGGGKIWSELANEVASLAINRLLDAKTGTIGEFYDRNWRPAPVCGRATVEPGHQFEWSWLLERWAKISGDASAHAAAVALFESGSRGVDAGRGVAIDEMDALGRPRQTSARLWPQTERLKAAKLLGRDKDVCLAAKGLWQYLEHSRAGLWHDRLNGNGAFDEGPAPASSLYHIVCAVAALQS